MSGIKAIQVPATVLAFQDYLRTREYAAFMDQMLLFDVHALRHRVLTRPETMTAEQLDQAERTLEAFRGDQNFFSGLSVSQSMADRLNITPLYHISEQMLAVAIHAASKLDSHEDIWTLESLPSLNGLLIFERPIYHLDGRGVQTACGAIVWHVYARRNGEQNVEMTMFAPASDPADAYGEALPEGVNLGPLHFVHTGAVPFGSSIGPMLMAIPDRRDLDAVLDATREDTGYVDENYRVMDNVVIDPLPHEDPLVGYEIDYINVHRVLYAIFMLMDQTITDISEFTDRKLARRGRNRTTRPFPMVTIIKLRRAEEHGDYDDDGVWKLRYRSMTRAHWRRQHTKDGVKKIWIHSYWRGPENAPVWQPHRVSTLER